MLKKVVYLFTIVSIFLIFIKCGDNPVGSSQTYTENRHPVIERFSHNLPNPDLLTGNMPIEISVEASDPDGDPITIEIASESGTFSDKERTRSTKTITYYTPEELTPGKDIIISVTVTDSKKASITQQFSLGSKSKSPTLTIVNHGATLINPYGKTSITFSADCDGKYQLYTTNASNEPQPEFNLDNKYFVYKKDTDVTITIDGPLATGGDLQLSSANFNKVYILLRDSYSQTSTISQVFYIDTETPSGSLIINDNAAHTTSSSVTLRISANSNDVDVMMISNNEHFTGATWEPYTQTREWTLTSGDGTKKVYIKFKDLASNESIKDFATIVLDQHEPTISTFNLLSPTKTANKNISILLAGSDAVGIYEWLINETGTINDGTWQQGTQSEYALTSGYNQTVTLYAWAKDGAGNISDRITMDKSIQLITPGTENSNWNKQINMNNSMTIGFSMALSPTKDLYVAGFTENAVTDSSSTDIFIRKYDKDGNEQNFAGTGGNQAPYCKSTGFPQQCTTTGNDLVIDYYTNGMDLYTKIAVNSEGDVFVSFISVDLSNGTGSVVIKKFDKDGNEITTGWDKSFSSIQQSEIRGIAVDSNDNVYFAGFKHNLISQSNPTESKQDWWIMKFNKDGTPLVFSPNLPACDNGTYSTCTTNGTDYAYDGGQNDLDEISGITIWNNNIIVYGRSDNRFIGSSGQDSIIIKFSQSGEKEWDRIYDDFWVNSVTVDSTEDIYLGGTGSHIVSSGSSSDWWIKKLNPSGNEITFSGTGTPLCTNSGDPDPNNNPNPCSPNGKDIAYATTYYAGTNYYGENIYSMALGRDDTIFAGGNSNHLFGASSLFDFQLMKFDSMGNRDDTYGYITFDMGQHDTISQLITDDDGNLYLLGAYNDSSVPYTDMDTIIIKKFYY